MMKLFKKLLHVFTKAKKEHVRLLQRIVNHGIPELVYIDRIYYVDKNARVPEPTEYLENVGFKSLDEFFKFFEDDEKDSEKDDVLCDKFLRALEARNVGMVHSLVEETEKWSTTVDEYQRIIDMGEE